jgi:hypothetical protein
LIDEAMGCEIKEVGYIGRSREYAPWASGARRG